MGQIKSMGQYARTLEELREHAVLFWPREVLEQEASLSVLPLLLKTQEKFISVLNISDAGPEAWNQFIDKIEEMPGNLFLKHLMVLTDLGGEALNKIPPFRRHFPEGVMHYIWHERPYVYSFRAAAEKIPLTNSALKVDGVSLLKGYPVDKRIYDVVMLLLHGAASIGNKLPSDVRDKCLIGALIGEPEALERFVRQNYIRVSRQVGGAASNTMGYLAQKYVRDLLFEELSGWKISSGPIPGISHNDGTTETTFDIVALSPTGIYFAIEVSFQFTTNSVIERKVGQAQARAFLMHEAGHHICYVIDGAGNINIRANAVRTICRYSDCTVAFSRDEIRHLAAYLKEMA